MEKIKTIKKMREYSRSLKTGGRALGFVPTMGFLHEGHLRLIREAREECAGVIVSIFVNPVQFGQNEDFDSYPRDHKGDIALLEKEGVDAVFIPSDREMYPEGYATYVDIDDSIAGVMCGKSRPGHFRGVATVVSKLLNIVAPDNMYMGQKDAQQAVIIKRMVSDLDFSAEVKVVPTVREPDGLAMSSRNTYLSKDEKVKALSIHRSLLRAKEMLSTGRFGITDVKDEMEKILIEADKIDYIEVLDFKDLSPVTDKTKKILVGVAAFIGNIRLIDNVVIRNKNIM